MVLPSSLLQVYTMAETPNLSKILKEMEQEITCAICHEHYHEPKMLPCLHYYYCIECLQRLAMQASWPAHALPRVPKAGHVPSERCPQIAHAVLRLPNDRILQSI